MFSIQSEYPDDAIGNADFISLAAKTRIEDRDARGELVMRDERIIVTDRFVDLEDVVLVGRVCLGEATVRMMASQLDMVDRVTMERVISGAAATKRENEALRAENEDLRQALEALRRIQIRQEAT